MSDPIDKVWSHKFIPLATYNAEVHRGLIHTDEYKGRMASLQMEYNERLAEYNEQMQSLYVGNKA